VAEEVVLDFLDLRAIVALLDLLDLLERMDLRVILETVDLRVPRGRLERRGILDLEVLPVLLEKMENLGRSVLRAHLD